MFEESSSSSRNSYRILHPSFKPPTSARGNSAAHNIQSIQTTNSAKILSTPRENATPRSDRKAISPVQNNTIMGSASDAKQRFLKHTPLYSSTSSSNDVKTTNSRYGANALNSISSYQKPARNTSSPSVVRILHVTYIYI
jgi:hypothetical protein